MSGKMTKKAAVIGAGISGLHASYLLEQQGVSVDLIDKEDRIGGRMISEKKDGFILDKGFHVLQTAYPLASSLFDYESLGCKAFEPGAMVIDSSSKKSKIWRFSDPFRRPIKGFFSVFNTFTNPLNLMRIGLLRLKILRISQEKIFTKGQLSTYDFLLSRGFSDSFIRRFFVPLFGGIFLENELRTDERMFKFVFRNMSKGNMVLPKEGIQACPKYLFEKLKSTNLILNSDVTIMNKNELSINGVSSKYDYIIKTYSDNHKSQKRDVWTVYFAAPKSPVNGKYLLLNSNVCEAGNLISHIAIPSDVQPSYAPDGQSLIVATIVGESASRLGLEQSTEIKDAAITELIEWFGEQVNKWRIIDVKYIVNALPELTSDDYDMIQTKNGKFECGDHTYHASVEGSLLSAQRTVSSLDLDGD